MSERTPGAQPERAHRGIEMSADGDAPLLPCPFCGGEARHQEDGVVACRKCGAIGPEANSIHRDDNAAAWNRRAALSERPAALAELLDQFDPERIEAARARLRAGQGIPFAEWRAGSKPADNSTEGGEAHDSGLSEYAKVPPSSSASVGGGAAPLPALLRIAEKAKALVEALADDTTVYVDVTPPIHVGRYKEALADLRRALGDET
jgi:hypothetical protein